MHLISDCIKFKFQSAKFEASIQNSTTMFLAFLLAWYTGAAHQTQHQVDKIFTAGGRFKIASDSSYNTNYSAAHLFRYTGSIPSATIPADVNSISVHMW